MFLSVVRVSCRCFSCSDRLGRWRQRVSMQTASNQFLLQDTARCKGTRCTSWKQAWGSNWRRGGGRASQPEAGATNPSAVTSSMCLTSATTMNGLTGRSRDWVQKWRRVYIVFVVEIFFLLVSCNLLGRRRHLQRFRRLVTRFCFLFKV